MSFVFHTNFSSRSSFGISVDGSSKNASEMGSHTTTSFLNSTGSRRRIYTSRRLFSPTGNTTIFNDGTFSAVALPTRFPSCDTRM